MTHDPLDLHSPEFGDFFDELPLWSAPFLRMMLERAPLVRGQTIVDIGSGTGCLSTELAMRSGRDSRIIAVDPWPSACQRLRRKLEFIGLRNVEIQERDAATIDLEDGGADLIVSNLGLNNFDNATEVLRECRRVLRPQGTILLSTNLVGHMQEFYDAFAAQLEALDLQHLLPALEEHVNHRATVSGLHAQLDRAGFEDVEIAESSMKLRYADGEAFLNHWNIRLGFLPAWRDIVPEDRASEVFGGIATRLGSDVSLTVPMACAIARG